MEARGEVMQHSPVTLVLYGPHGLWHKSATAGQLNVEDLEKSGCASTVPFETRVAHLDIKARVTDDISQVHCMSKYVTDS